jgi:DNA polymerase-1
MKQYMIDNYETVLRPELEADDILGILATGSMLKGKKIIVTKDKDLKTIPAPIYLTHKTDLGIVETTVEEADRFHLIQALAGDVTDGYAGCPTVGMETAAKIIDGLIGWEKYEHTFKSGARKGLTETRWKTLKVDTPWEAVVSAYNKQGLGEDEALRQAQVARILRAEDYDFTNKKVRLWKL